MNKFKLLILANDVGNAYLTKPMYLDIYGLIARIGRYCKADPASSFDWVRNYMKSKNE